MKDARTDLNIQHLWQFPFLETEYNKYPKQSGLPGGPVVNNLPCNAGDTGSVPGQGTETPHGVGGGGWKPSNY